MAVVLKIGGSSQDTPEKAEKFVEEVAGRFGRNEPLVLVVSAIDKTTDDVEKALREGRTDISHLMPMHNERFARSGGDGTAYNSARDDFRTFYGTYIKNQSPQLKAAVMVSPERLASFLMASTLEKIRGRKALWLDFYDERFPLAATAGESNYLSASVDLPKSEERAQEAAGFLKEYDIVIPGFGGVYLQGGNAQVKTFGRGGSDEAAFGCGYAFGADEIWICSDVYGIKSAVIEGEKTVTIPRLDIEEAKAAAFLGAKLPSEQALRPLEAAYGRASKPKVYVAHAQNLGGDKTEITPMDASMRMPAKLVAGRDVDFYYEINGDPYSLIELERELIGAGADYRVFGKSGTRAVIGIFGKGSDIADAVIKGHERKGLSVGRYTDRAIVGVVGSGMEHIHWLAARMYTILSENGINVSSSSDYSGACAVAVVQSGDRQRSIKVLHDSLPYIRNGHYS